MSIIYLTYFDSPLGTLLLTSDGAALTGLYMNEHKNGLDIPLLAGGKGSINTRYPIPDDDALPFEEARKQLTEYFAGARTTFALPFDAAGTDFQKRVWEELTKIPYGVTISYGELADRIGNPKASRAVGLANGHNPLSIIVPCHRVIGANGTLTGYGGGMERKKALLDFEAEVINTGKGSFDLRSEKTLFEEYV